MRPARWAAAAFCLFVAGLALGWPAPVYSQRMEQRIEDSWTEFKRELKEFGPSRVEAGKNWIESLRVVRRPKVVLSSYEADPALYAAITGFYDHLKGRELDVYEEQEGIPAFFPNRDLYYDFLDTILPAMRDRKFERNRILEYQLHAIEPDPENPNHVVITMSVTSDDTYPFGKLMIYDQHWRRGPRGWYPGKVEAEPATFWEKVR